MKRLTEIGHRTQTDKATYHHFTEVYDDIFSGYSSPRLLEIGVAKFGSIQMYLEYFENPYIVAMDIEDKDEYLSDKWKFVKGDQCCVEDLAKCVEEEKYDIIIDDGGHTMKQQQVTLGVLLDQIKPGGYYILEDLHTSFRADYIESDCQFTSYEMLVKIRDKEIPFSNYIPIERQQEIIHLVDKIDIFVKYPDYMAESVTSIIKIKS